VVEDLLHQDRNDEVAHDGPERDDDREDETPAQLRAEPEPGDQDAPRAAEVLGDRELLAALGLHRRLVDRGGTHRSPRSYARIIEA
jgi:hypothetical protein